jgi:hypothetical protein
MTQPTRNTPQAAGAARRAALAVLSAGLFVGIALYAARSSLPPGPAAAVADEPKAKTPAAPAPRAAAAAAAFLDALDDKQRQKAV